MNDEILKKGTIELSLFIKLTVLTESIKGIEPKGYALEFLKEKNLMNEYKEFVKNRLENIIRKVNEEITEEEREYLKQNKSHIYTILSKAYDGENHQITEKRGRPKKVRE